MKRTILAVVMALSCIAAAPSDPAERLPDPTQEARARALFKSFRCVVCQNESIDESNADIAADQRRIVRRQIASGRSDQDIRAYMVQRYGEFVLMRPSFSAGNALLWLTPVLVLALGGAYLLWAMRKPRTAEETLTPEEAAAVRAAIEAEAATLPPRSGGNTAAHGPENLT